MYQASNAPNAPIISNTAFANYELISPTKRTYEFSENGNIIEQTYQFESHFENNNQQQYQQQQDILIPEDYNQHPQQVYQQQQQQRQQQVQQQQQQQQNNDLNASISFALDEINAVINSKDFVDILENNKASELNPQVSLYQEVEANTYYQQDNQEKVSPNYYIANSDTVAGQKMATDNKNNNYNNMFAPNLAMFNHDAKSKPFVEIVEQPAKCALRFRYKCEGRSAGSLPGVNSSTTNKTFPAIKISNYEGRAVVVISCVTKDAPYMAHPHNIVGKEGCKKGICTIVINNEVNTIRSFNSLGIQCVKRRDIEDSLTLRESINVDPFRNGFAHKSLASNIDLNVVRLCFQVFIEGSTPNKCDVPLVPVVSDPIHDKKAMSDLVITKLSHCSAPATGGREVILLCDRIAKDDIQIRFYEERDGKLIWETYTDLSPADVHKKVAICFRTPKYYNENITQPVMVRLQLKRMSDNQTSEPRSFQFLPCESDEDIISRKRQKIEWVNMNHHALDNILQPQQHYEHPHHRQHQQEQIRQPSRSPQAQQLSPHPSSSHQAVPNRQQQQQQQQPQSSKQDQSSLQSHNQQRVMLMPQQSRLSPSNQQHQQQPDSFPVENSPNLVVRHEIIDNDGKVMRLVDRPSAQANAQQQLDDNNQNNGQNKPLGSSLDRIDTAELMRDMQFNSNMDFNLGSNLSLQ